MKDCYYDLGLHFILLDDPSQSYILKLRDRLQTAPECKDYVPASQEPSIPGKHIRPVLAGLVALQGHLYPLELLVERQSLQTPGAGSEKHCVPKTQRGPSQGRLFSGGEGRLLDKPTLPTSFIEVDYKDGEVAALGRLANIFPPANLFRRSLNRALRRQRGALLCWVSKGPSTFTRRPEGRQRLVWSSSPSCWLSRKPASVLQFGCLTSGPQPPS